MKKKKSQEKQKENIFLFGPHFYFWPLFYVEFPQMRGCNHLHDGLGLHK